MGLFRKSAPAEPLAVTMAGVRLGHRLLAVGTRDTKLVAQLATKAGLTGRACVVDDNAERLASGAAAIEKEGALVEATRAPFGMLPFDAESFDVAVIADLLPSLTPDGRVSCVVEVYRVLRPGGRVLAIEPGRRGGIVGFLNRQPGGTSYEGAQTVLHTAGFAAVRQLAETDGVIYVEGIKKA